MADLQTQRGNKLYAGVFFQAVAAPANFELALVSDTPDQDTKLITELTEATGAGYARISVARDGTDFPELTETDGSNLTYVRMKDQTFTGIINTFTHAILVDDSATPEVICAWDVGTQALPTSNDTFTLKNAKLQWSN